MELNSGTWVWVQLPDVKYLRPGKIASVNGKDVSVVVESNVQQVPLSNVKVMHQNSIDSVADMTQLADLHEGSLLHNLRLRYQKNEIYTYVGSILVAVNPYKQLKIYEPETIRQYRGVPLGELPPHIFAIADNAYNGMLKDDMNQCMIISGESGAGKTESTKIILQYLAVLSGKHSQIEDRILASSPILEAFGNACTVRNNNSSRFGKFIEIQFDSNGAIIGGKINEYLLEKSRIVNQASGERNYHSFYNLLAGMTEQEKKQFGLTQADKYEYLNKGNMIKVDGINDKKDYEILKQAMDNLGFDESTINSIMRILAIILHLGNLQFQSNQDKEEESTITNNDVVSKAAELMSIPADILQKSLCNRTSITRGETFITPLNAVQASDSRDALSKALYSFLFSWLVRSVNEKIELQKFNHSIGVLDIFGFEDFQKNSFEQMCINYANEKLQQFFNQHIFKLEQEEYKREGIQWNEIQFIDNQPCLDMISKKPFGILPLLDEETGLPKTNDKSFLEKIRSKLDGNQYFFKDKKSDTCFAIVHYAGKVLYQVEGFLDKNRDMLRQDLEKVIIESQFDFMSQLITTGTVAEQVKKDMTIRRNTATQNAPKVKTAGSKFDESLTMLVSVLSNCHPHFIRCVKPNMRKKPEIFDDDMILQQLQYSGLLETVRIRQAGYPVRKPFADFIKRYYCQPTSKGETDQKKIIEQHLKSLKNDGNKVWYLGHTKIFFKEQLETELEKRRTQIRNQKVITIQKNVKTFLARKRYIKMKKSQVLIGKTWKQYKQRQKYLKLKKATVKAQSLWKTHQAKKQLKSIKSAILTMQTIVKTKLAQAYVSWLYQQTKIVAEDEKRNAALREKENQAAKFKEIDGIIHANLQKLQINFESSSEFEQLFTPQFKIPDVSVPKSVTLSPFFDSDEDKQQYEISKFVAAYCKNSVEEFSDQIISLPLLSKFNSEYKTLIPAISYSILCLMRDQVPTDNAINMLQRLMFILKLGHKYYDIRDEIYMQLIKQLTNHPKPDGQALGWKLLCLFITFIPPSENLSKYLFLYVENLPPLSKYMQLLIKRQLKIKNHIIDFDNKDVIFQLQSSTQEINVSLPNDTSLVVNLDVLSNTQEVIQFCLEQEDVMYPQNWNLSYGDQRQFISENHNFIKQPDVIGSTYKLIKSFIDTDEPMRDEPTVDLIYQSVLKQLKAFTLSLKEYTGIKDIVNVYMQINQSSSYQDSLISLLSSKTFDSIKDSNFAAEIDSVEPISLSKIQLKKQFTLLCSFIPCLLSKRYNVKFSVSEQSQDNLVLHIDKCGIHIVLSDYTSIVHSFQFENFTLIAKEDGFLELIDQISNQKYNVQSEDCQKIMVEFQNLQEQLRQNATWAIAIQPHLIIGDTSMLELEIGDVIFIKERKRNDPNWVNGENLSVDPKQNGWFPVDCIQFKINKPQSISVRPFKLKLQEQPAVESQMAESLQKLSVLSENEPVPFSVGNQASPLVAAGSYSSPSIASSSQLQSVISSPPQIFSSPSNSEQVLQKTVEQPVQKTQKKSISLGGQDPLTELYDWALQNFRVEAQRKSGLLSIRGTIRRMGSHDKELPKNDIHHIQDKFKYSKSPPSKSLLKIKQEEEKLSHECHLSIMKYMGDYPLKDLTTVEILLQLIIKGLESSQEVKSEIFLFCVKQLIQNQDEKSFIKGWNLLKNLTQYFAPHQDVAIIISKWIRTFFKTPIASLKEVIKEAESNLQTTLKFGQRKVHPTLEELTFIELGRPLSIQFQFADGSSKRLAVQACSPVQEILNQLCQKILIFNQQLYGIYSKDDKGQISLLYNDEYIMDCYYDLDHNQKKLNQVFYKKLLFQKVLFDEFNFDEIKEQEIALNYAFAFNNFLSGVYKPSLLQVETFAAYQIYVTNNDAFFMSVSAQQLFDPQVKSKIEDLFKLILPPITYQTIKLEVWIQTIQQRIKMLSSSNSGSFNRKDAMIQGIKLAQTFQLFGAHFYDVIQPSFDGQSLGDQLQIAVTANKLLLILNGQVLRDWSFLNISTFSYSEEKFNFKVGGLMVGSGQGLGFTSKVGKGVGKEICFLINSYLQRMQ